MLGGFGNIVRQVIMTDCRLPLILHEDLTVALVKGVDYSANIIGYLQGGAKDGGPEMARLVRLARTQCPSTQVIMSTE